MRRISYQNSTLLHWGGREKFTSTSFCNWVTFDEDDAATSPFFTNWTDVALSKCNMLIFTLSSKKKKTLVKLHDKVGGSNFYLKKLIKIELSWLARKPLPDSSFALNLCFTDRDPDLYKVWSAFDCFLDTLWYSPISIFHPHDSRLWEAKNSCLMSPRTAVQSPHCLDLYLGTLRTDVHKTRCCSHSFIVRVLSHSPAKNYCFSITSLFIGFVALNFVSQYLTIYWIKC